MQLDRAERMHEGPYSKLDLIYRSPAATMHDNMVSKFSAWGSKRLTACFSEALLDDMMVGYSHVPTDLYRNTHHCRHFLPPTNSLSESAKSP